MNERCAIPLVIDPLEVDHELVRVMLSIRKDFGAKQANNMVRDHCRRFILKIRIIDTKVRVEPVDFVRYELAGHESLISMSVIESTKLESIGTHFTGDVGQDLCPLLILISP